MEKPVAVDRKRRNVLLAVTLLLIYHYLPQPKHLHGAVTTEVSECTDIGSQIILDGGNAADAMVAATICIGVFNPHLSGLGGGGFMLIRSKHGYETIDFRETAPALATEDMYVRNISSSLYGGLAVGAYGEPAGLEMLHRKYGHLKWEKLFTRSIEYARHGFRVIPEVAANIVGDGKEWVYNDPAWAAVYAPDGTPLGPNSTTTRPTLADTLEKMAKHGAKVMYSGDIANASVIAARERGGILSLDDLAGYKAISRPALAIKYRDYTIHSAPAPASGAIALSALNILSGYDMQSNASTHILIESLKFAYGQRTLLGDPAYVDTADLEKSFISPQTAARIRSSLTVDHTQGPEVYNPENYEILNDHGTSQLVTADSSGLVIVLTSTVNTYFGSLIMTPSGIILNNEQNDFSSPNTTNVFGYIPTPANFIRPFKRPLSSIAPLIVDFKGSFKVAIGAAGGSRITSAVVQTLSHVLDLKQSLADAIAQPRLHDQIYPLVTTFETDFDNATVAAMQSMGHNVTRVRPGMSIVMGVAHDTSFEAVNDPRQESGSSRVL